jgi:predicted MFS family arabinose efflux permease
MAIYSLGIPLGTFFGGAFGAWAAGRFGWRGAFLSLAIPGLLVAAILPLLVREPVRGGLDEGEAAKAPAAPFWTSVGLFLKSATLVLVTLGCSLSAVVGYSLQSWSPAFLMRVQGATLGQVGSVYAPLIAISVAAGIFGSGWVVDRLGAKSLRAYPLFPAACFVLAFPLYVAAVSVHDWRLSVALLAIPQGLTFTYLAPAVAVVQNLVPPSRRSTASAMLLFVLNLLAVGCGPLYVGAVSDWAKPTYGVESLRVALYALIPFFVLGVGCNYAASVAMKKRAS